MSGSSPTDPEIQGEAQPRAGLFGRRMLQSPREALQPEDAPPPPPPPPRKKRRRPGLLSAVSGFMSFLLIVAVAGIGGLMLMQSQLRDPGPLANDKVVIISPRTEVSEILNQLEVEGVIEHPILLNLALVMEGNRSKVKAGEYLFKQQASLRDVIDTLVSGKEILHSITIPEGLTSEQIIQRLRENDLLTGDVREMPKEGTLLPETYRVARGMARSDLIRKMQDDQKRVLDQVWARRPADTTLRSPYELVTLASIVEKETGKADERPRVAGVFINRLQKHMKLQSDPTIVYGLVGGKGTLGRGILRSEVERPTAYNTYVIEGLPPGPIANPGRAALEAVISPSRTKDLYFVADGTGGHTFAETLDQHNRNVVRWRQIEREAREKQGQGVTVDQVMPDAAPAAANPAAPATGPAPLRGTRGDLQGPADGAATGVTTATAAMDAATQSAPPQSKAVPGQQPNRFGGLSFATQGMDQLFAPPPTARSMLDGPVDEPAAVPGDPTTYPVNARMAAEQRARAARLGLPTMDDNEASTPAPAAQAPAVPKVVRIYDASEGTPLDPLKDKSWDLNSAKVIPDLPAPGAAPAATGKPAAAGAKPSAPKPPTKVAEKPAAPKPAAAKPAPKPAAQKPKPASTPAPAAADDD